LRGGAPGAGRPGKRERSHFMMRRLLRSSPEPARMRPNFLSVLAVQADNSISFLPLFDRLAPSGRIWPHRHPEKIKFCPVADWPCSTNISLRSSNVLGWLSKKQFGEPGNGASEGEDRKATISPLVTDERENNRKSRGRCGRSPAPAGPPLSPTT
jgi:hypothetical protein